MRAPVSSTTKTATQIIEDDAKAQQQAKQSSQSKSNNDASASSNTSADHAEEQVSLGETTIEEMRAAHDNASGAATVGATASSSAPQDQSDAFNAETGEINWDCPCLGPMTQPPCGELFKTAFSCFVYSTAEPKGYDCVEQFRAMQSCFKEHPDVYGEQWAQDDDDADDSEDDESDSESEYSSSSSSSSSDSELEDDDDDDEEEDVDAKREKSN